MTFYPALVRAILRRRGWSLACAAFLAWCIGSLSGVPVVLVVLTWLASGILALETWLAIEGLVLSWHGARLPDRLERERLTPLLAAGKRLLVLDLPAPFVLPVLRYAVVSRGALDLLEDRALLGLLTQATDRLWFATFAGELLVWVAMLPLLAGWFASLWLSLLTRALAVLVGWGLILPMVLCPSAFVRWVGRLFGAGLVGLIGVLLLADGLPAAALVFWLAWLAVPAMKRLLEWEWRRAEAAADGSTLAGGFGWQLHEALETLAVMDEVPGLPGLLGLLFHGSRRSAAVAERAERVWQALRHS